MANQRTFLVQALTTNGVDVGGVSTLTFNSSYRSVIQSTPDGALGSEDVDRAGLRVAVQLNCSDVTLIRAILNSTPGDTVFYVKKSGAATFREYTIPTASAQIVWTGASIDFNLDSDARLTVDGLVRFMGTAIDLQDAITVTDDAAIQPTGFYPSRLYRPNTAGFTPTAGALISPLHVKSMRLACNAVVIEDFADLDIGHTAVDIGGWNPATISLVHRDSVKKAETPDTNIAAQIMGKVRGVLTVVFVGRAGGANQTLTVKNLLFTGCDQNESADYTEYSMSGSAGWKQGADVFTMNDTLPLFDFA